VRKEFNNFENNINKNSTKKYSNFTILDGD